MSASFILIWDIYRISQIIFYSFSIDYILLTRLFQLHNSKI